MAKRKSREEDSYRSLERVGGPKVKKLPSAPKKPQLRPLSGWARLRYKRTVMNWRELREKKGEPLIIGLNDGFHNPLSFVGATTHFADEGGWISCDDVLPSGYDLVNFSLSGDDRVFVGWRSSGNAWVCARFDHPVIAVRWRRKLEPVEDDEFR